MKTLKSAAESIIRRCRGTGHRTKLIKRPAIIILIAIMIITSVLSPSGLTLGSGGLSPVPVKAAGAEDGTSSGEADNAESSTGSAREETGNTDAGASESEGEKEDKDNTASDVKKGGNDAASQDQGGDTGIAEDAGKGDYEEKSGSANGSSDKKNNETKDAAADSDKSGKKGNEAAGAGSGEKNTSKDSGSGRKNSSDRDNVSENGTQGTTAPENDEIILTETARDKSYTITVRGDKYSGLKNVDKMTVLEITRDDQFYEEFVKKLNKTLNKTTEGQIQDIRLYDIEFTDQNGLPVHLKRNVDVTITYNNYKASPKVEMNQVVRAFIATTVTYYGFFTNVTTSFAKAYASGAGARVSRTGMTGNTAAADRQIKISKTEWIDEKEILTDISRNRVNEVTYILPKDGVTGIAVIGKDPEIRKPEQGQGQTEDKGETATEAQTADKIEAGKEAKPEDKSETATETQPEDKSEAATEAQPGDKSEAGKENQPEGENGDGQDSQTGTQKEENSEARTADQTQTSPETQTADQPETGPEAQTGDQNEAGQETQPEKTLTVKGKDYRVTVTYDDKAGLPEGARLTAREIGDYSRSYKNYLSQAESALTKDKQVNTARFFDITIWDGAGNKIEPKSPVRVSIEFDSVDVQDKGNVELIHFEEDKKNAGAGSGKAQILHDVEVQDGEKKDTVDGVSFDIGGFSVFGVLQTVQVLKMTASDGKQYKVTVTYDDTCGIPADAKLIVNEISKTDKRYNDYVDKTAETLGKDAGQFSYAHALDIMLVGQVTGKHYQPTKDVKVSIELLKEDISEDQDVNVVHFQGDEKNTASRMDSKVDEGSVEFETDGFSVYVITGEDAVPRRTYNFYIWKDNTWSPYIFTSDNGVETSSQTVRNGQKPIVPSPEKNAEGKLFSGWYERTDSNSGDPQLKDKPYDFDTPVTENEEIELYAVFSDYLNVIFHDQYNDKIHSFPIANTRRQKENVEGKATITIGDVSTTYSGGRDMAFYGWSYTPITVPGAEKDDNGDNVSRINSETIEISTDTHLYPIYKPVKWLSFWSGPTGSRATYYPTQSYFDGVGPETLADHVPTRSGYTFLGWYAGTMDPTTGEVTYGANPITNADGTLINNASDAGMSVYGNALHLTTDATLYAKWSGEETVNYKIIIWKQKTTASDDTLDKYKYDFVKSIDKFAPVGSMATIDEEYKKYADPQSQYHDTAYLNYTCHSDADVEVDENGYTILNVYYDRTGTYTGSGSGHNLIFKNCADDSELKKYDSVNYNTELLTGNQGDSYVPDEANLTRENYTFTGWFADKNCSTQVFFSREALDAYTGHNKTVLYDKMPDEDLTIYAGWEAEWYLVQIDPNYGDFHGSGATWTWKTIESDLIQEYSQVTRDYVESSSGQNYYVKHDRAFYGYEDNKYYDNEPSERNAYYTDKPGQATEDKTFEEAPGIYSYAGWYEVNADGTETPYDFGKHVDHDTLIRLHWKKAGDFYLRYNDGKGTGDTTDDVITDDTNCYADNAEILITKGATDPEGYTFIGWRVQGDIGGTVYAVGDTFTLQSDDAVSVSGKATVTLEAVYTKLGTARIIYDFNGGTADSTFDYGQPKDSSQSVSYDTETKTVSNIVNNSDFCLSDGTGLAMENATLKGWSTSKAYNPETDTLYTLGGEYGVDTEDPITLYAVWEVNVTWHLNVPNNESTSDFNWGGEWTGYKEENKETETVKTKTVYLGNSESEPSDVPKYTGNNNLMFSCWSKSADSNTAYNYTQPVLGALDLYACWSAPKEITAHALDASEQTLSEKTNNDGWNINNVSVGQETVELTADSHVTAPNGYTYAFAAVSADLDSVSAANSVTEIRYNSSSHKIEVKYKGESQYRILSSNSHIYFVYYQDKTVNIGYKEMGPSGVLDNVSGMSSSAPASAAIPSSPDSSGNVPEPYNMATGASTPLAWGNNGSSNQYTSYAFAVGKVDQNSSTQMNASDLSLITSASDSDEEGSRPVLRVRNTWRGFEYTTDSGDDPVWTNCGYNPQLYVIYYEQQPTVIMFKEKTVGLSTGSNAAIDNKFTYNLKVTETTTNTQKQIKDGENWKNEGNIEDVTTDIFDTTVSPNTPYTMKNEEENSAILFHSNPSAGTIVSSDPDGTWQYVATENSVTSQTAVITQEADPDFTTFINDTEQDSEPYKYEYTSDGTGGTKNVIFTNKHKKTEVEVHVARIENGTIKLRDNLRNKTDEATYKFSLPIEESGEFLTKLPENTVYDDQNGIYAFGAVVAGSDNGTEVTIEEMGVDSVSYSKAKDNLYELLMKSSDGESLGDLDSNKIYYLYYPMPKIQYVKQEGTTLSLIRGSTDGINPGNKITYGGAELQMNGVTVTQDQRISLPVSGLRISQKSGAANFKMAPILDDETYQRYLSYTGIGVGAGISSGQTQDISQLENNVSNKLEMLLQIKDNSLSWSFDGTDWYPMTESQSIYAIYTECGYDFQLSKVVNTSESGSNPIFTDRNFTVTIEPLSGNSFNKAEYDIEGYSSNKVNVDNGKITLTVEDGTIVKIHKLRRGGYKITESNNDNFDLSVKSGTIIGEASTDEDVTGSSVNITLDNEKQIVLKNSPKAICEVVRGNDDDGVLFYTLTDAINYIVDNYADGTATIAMLTDYLMPAEDNLTIPSSTHITLTTATKGSQKYSGSGRAVISRSAGANAASMIRNNGELELINITFDGKSVEATEPLIHSVGTLTVNRGTTLQNAFNSGNGGAISATGSVSVVDGSDVYLRNNRAANGGLLYYSGTGAVTVSGGSMNTNIATNGSGGAIYAVGGTLTLSGGTFSGNTAAQNGGAVYGENAVIMLSGSTVTGNKASGSGGAVYSAAGAVTVSGGSVSNNTAAQNGGAICTDSGKVTVSGGSVNTNEATNGSGGAIYTNIGAVEISGTGTSTAVNGNKAKKGNGGAVYANTGSVTISGGSVGAGTSANLAKNGGAVYAASGTVKVSGGSITGNTATENGGAIYAGSGTVSVSGGSMAGNSATGTGETTGFGGAVFVNTGSAAVSGGVIGVSSGTGAANSAKNGAAIYINNGTGSFSGGTVSGNNATASAVEYTVIKDGATITLKYAGGGAIGVGAETVRLDFSGTIKIQENTANGITEKVNVYLDQDTDGVINTGGFESDAYVGIYVPNKNNDKGVEYLFKNRGGIGAEFGICSSDATTLPAFKNDRETNLTAAVNSTTKKIYWSSKIKVNVNYLSNFSTLPTGSNGTETLKKDSYYPSVGNVAISMLADELRGSCKNLSATAVYATALFSENNTFDGYLTRLLWEEGKWKVEKRNGDKVELGTKRIIIYYSEPAYLSIENNADFDFNITTTDLTVNLAGQNRSLLNNSTTTGFGLVYAKDGVIQEQLLPVQANASGTYTLSQNGGSVIILIPGGRSTSFVLNGTFVNGTGTVQVRQTGQAASSVKANETLVRNGTTPSDSSIYEIIFGPDKAICKIVCAEPTDIDPEDYVDRSSEADNNKYEYTFSKMQKAVDFAKKYKLTDVDIEMLVDYLMPSTDTAVIADPTGGHFESVTLTTATTGEFKYSGASSDGRATISRGIGNEQPLVDVTGNVGTSGNNTETHVYVHDINFDGKNLTGACEGGALATKDCCVSISNAKFVNCVSRNGGAVFISFGTPNNVGKGSTKKYSFASGYQSQNAMLTLNDVQVSNCKATYFYKRSGGGAIWSNAKIINATNCGFTNCVSDGSDMQGGAVFHRIESTNSGGLIQTPYFASSQTIFTDCTFTGCKAEAGGGIESDATDIQMDTCTFTNCSTTKKDGGALNVYIYETNYNYTSIPSAVTLTDCNFISCTSNRNGGAVRSLAVDTVVTNCTFTNTVAKNDNSGNGGGAIYVSNQDSNTTTITDCTFTGAVSNKGMGGAVYTLSKWLTVTDTTMTNCKANGSSNGNGGAIYHNPNNRSNLATSYISLTDCTIKGCTAKLAGGAVYTYAKNGDAEKKTLVRCTIENCTAKTEGGGVYMANPNVSYVIIEETTIQDCSSESSGGGLYSKALYLTISGEAGSRTLISGCTSGANGGGVYHYRQNAEINVSHTTINGCTASESGGGFYTSYAKAADFTNCVISNNSVTGASGTAATKGCGGGILFDTSASFSLTNTTVSGNKASNLGGGIYTKKYLTLVCSIIEENELTTNTVANAAGVYMTDDGVLVIGASGSEIDNSAVMNNTTANGADSNLRMPVYTSGTQNGENKNCVTVNSPLGTIEGKGGYIGVTNAWKVGTQFGVSNITGDPTGLKDPDGVVVKDAVFNADTSTLYGIISRTDDTRKKIVWAGPPVCKITDADGKLLYFKDNGSDPAIFDVLENGVSDGRTSAFSLLRGSSIKLYYEPESEGGTGTQYSGTTFTIKMLVETYELTHQITTVDSNGKTIILTTAGKGDKDGYPFDNEASGTRAEITRGSGVTGSMATVRTNMQFRNILLDGNNTSSDQDGAIVSVEGTKDITVELQSNVIFQNGKAANGGAVAVTNGTFRINGGLIRFCEATANGGAVYASNSNIEKGFVFAAGNIQQCNAVDGAGVYVNDGVFNMSGGSISGCTASQSGGGVYVAGRKTMKMSGGRIGTDGANHAAISGGGISAGLDAQLNFTKRVNISRNTCDGSDAAGRLCNVQLDQNYGNTNEVIRTEGLYARSYIGVYVPGTEGTGSLYDNHGLLGKPFGHYTGSSANLYCFVNDRNGLKGGLIAETDEGFKPDTIYWIKIFSIEISKEVDVSDNIPNSVKTYAQDKSFTFTVRLWDTNENISSIKVKDIAEEIAAAEAADEDSKYGNIPFVLDSNNNNLITAEITIKSGEENKATAENLPDGLGYDVTETNTEGFANIPMKTTNSGDVFDASKPVNFQSGKTGENKNRTDINPYVSTVKFTNILPVCKVTDTSGNLLYRNGTVGNITNGKQTPAVYKNLSEAFYAVNSGALYAENTSLSFSGGCHIEMLLPEYTLTEGQTLTSSRTIILKTAAVNTSDNYPFNPTGETLSNGISVSTIRRGSTFTNASMFTLTAATDLTITGVKLDGNLIQTAANGGLVKVTTNAKLTVKDGAVLQNSRTTENGAGVYVASGAHLYLSGDPVFGTTDTDGFGYLYNDTGNFKVGVLSGKQNGGKDYTVAHQDIYLEESHENSPASMIINGDLSGDAGSIWVWAESNYHCKQLMPFAQVGAGISFVSKNKVDTRNKKYDADHLKIFRNARDDQDSDNTTGEYLYGTIDEDQAGSSGSTVYVYWNGIKGSRRVILRKVSSTYESVPGAVFTIYRKGNSNPVEIKHEGETNETLVNLPSQSSGVIWIGDLPYGTYYMRETVPSGYRKTTNGDEYNWFILTVNENGVGYLKNDGSLEKSINAEADKPN